MKVPFLKSCASYLFSTYNQDLSNLTLVFPSRRSSLVFKHYLSEVLQKPIFLPPSITINEFFFNLSDIKEIHPIDLSFSLFTIYKSISHSTESFDEFYPWGELILADFDSIDKYKVNAEDIFKSIEITKEHAASFEYLSSDQIKLLQQFWISFHANESKEKEQFGALWKHLFTVYQQLTHQLLTQGKAYQGMVYRNVAENITDYTSKLNNTYVFIGFNALNECEKSIFTHLKQLNKALFLWDVNEEFTLVENKAASLFMRENVRHYPNPDDFSRNSRNDIPVIKVYSSPTDTAQLQIARNIIDSEQPATEKFDDTVLVLCNEKLLEPCIASLPNSLEKVNITMGHSIMATSVYELLVLFMRCEQDLTVHHSLPSYYYKSFMAFLIHPLTGNIWNESSELLAKIQENKLLYIPIVSIEHQFTGIFGSKLTIGAKYQLFLEIIINHTLATENHLEAIAAQSLFEYNQELEMIIEQSKMEINPQTYRKMLQTLSRGLTIPFEGEPLRGLQIMGFLETRALDFKNIIIISANEGTLPKNSSGHSFIPYSIRKAFNLPTIEYQEAMYAYYFYRFFHYADNIHLIYTAGGGNSEKSRYITEMQLLDNYKIEENTLNYSFLLPDNQEIKITKNSKFIDRIHTLNEYSFSPSALANYISCTLKYYYKYIAQIPEEKVINEDIDAAEFGNIIHYSMEKLYNEYLHKELSSTDFKAIKAQIPSILKESIIKILNIKSEDIQGSIELVYIAAQRMIENILAFDAKKSGLIIEKLEHKIRFSLDINSKLTSKVNIGGKVDRLDTLAGKRRVVDYKTGKVELKIKSIDELFKSGSKFNAMAFQLCCYSMILHELENNQYQPCVYPARELTIDSFDESLIIDATSINNEFKVKLIQLLEELFSMDVPFEQTDDKKTCENCNYINLCNKKHNLN